MAKTTALVLGARAGRGRILLKSRVARLALLGLCLAGAASPGEVLAADPAKTETHEHREPVVLAPGYAELSYPAPVPGTYQLPPLGPATDGVVLDSQGQAHELHDLMGDRLVLLSFIYTSCSDVNGCPLATHVFSKVARKLAAAADLEGQVRLLSLSFDPEHDVPAVMRGYGGRFQRTDGADWRFLTTTGIAALKPILNGYDQWVIRETDETGQPLGTIAHLLRVYLIDRERRIRNIYSVSFLHADTIASDLRTLLLEELEISP
ncbi:MAG: SCO family protein [Pseudomonadota bacterium]